MKTVFNLTPETLQRLEQQAEQDGCTVDELIDGLLEYRQTTEVELQQVKLNLKEALGAGRVGLWDWNFMADKATYSDEWKQILGYAPHEFEDKHANFIAHVHPDDLVGLSQTIERAIAEIRQSEVVEFRLRHKDGHYRWVMATGSILTNADGIPERLIGSIIDITGQKNAEEALRHSEERYRNVIENLNDMCVLFDPQLKIIMTNPTAVAYTGIPRLALLGKHSEDIFPPSYHALLESARDTKKIQAAEITLDGLYGQRTLIVKNIPIMDVTNRLENIVSITHDITEHQQMQAREFELQLEKERIQLLGEFVQDAAHEFRTPLSTIKSSTYLMKQTGLNDKHRVKADQIEMQVSRIQRLVDTLLMMAKLERSDELHLSAMDVYALLKRTCDDVKSLYEHETPDIICNIPKGLPAVQGDLVYLTEAIKQIVDNAVRFTAQDGKITVSAGVESEWVWVEIADTGIGIHADDLAHIVKTFWRQDEAHSTPGFGLGLPIAQRIITLHGGDLTINSTLNEGTTVRITMPKLS